MKAPDMTNMKRREMNALMEEIWDKYMADEATAEDVFEYTKAYEKRLGREIYNKEAEIRKIEITKETELKFEKSLRR